jgi:pimeloyl-ACP methyl ester carboxylesterase
MTASTGAAMRMTATLLLLSCLTGCTGGEPDVADTSGEARASDVDGEARSVDGVPIRYAVRGTGEPTLVLVHGWTNSRAIWGEHPRTLSRTHRVVALDLAGHGESGADRAQWSIDGFGEDVVAVVEQLALDSVVLVGFSMGGAVVLEAADRMPDRVLGVVLVDAFHDPDEAPPDSMADVMEAQFRANWGDTAFLRAFGFTPDAPDSLIQYVAASSPAQPREHWFPILRAAFTWTRDDAKTTLASVRPPIAAINTTRAPTRVDAIRRYAPSFTVDTMDGVGHAGILLQRVEDFDAKLLAIVERFASAERRRD